MVILRAGLYLGSGIALLATWLSLGAGYPMEVATLRGLLAFMASGTVAYLAELVVMTAPPRARRAPLDGRDASMEELDDTERPVQLPAVRAERDAAGGESRAA